MSLDVHLLVSTAGANAVVFVGGVMVIVSTGAGQQGAVVVQIAVSSPHLPGSWSISSEQFHLHRVLWFIL